MLKHLILFLISLSFVVSTIGCTSSEPEEEDSSADVEMADAIDNAAEEGGEAAEGDDPFASDFGGDEEIAGDLGSDDLAPSEDAFESGGEEDPFAEGGDDAFDEGGGDDFAFDEGSGDDLAANDSGEGDIPMEEAFGGEDTAVADELPAEDIGSQETFSEPVTDTGAEDFASEDTGIEMDDDLGVMDDSFQETPEKTWVPIKKIADTPFTKNGILINSVYIARNGDTIESIAQKIYGSDRSDDLYTANPSFRSSTLDTGEKVYYNSPNRPNDDSLLKTFYEDVGLAPETYIAQDGDNIRAVSKKLLGDNDSWKEVWATNPDVESKAEISGGTALRYWASSDVAASSPPVAANDPEPEPSMDDLPPPPAEEPPPMPDMAANDPPPPPPEPPSIEPPPAPDMAGNDSSPGMGSVEPPPPPPPPPPSAMGSVEPPPPPPPPPSMAKKRLKADTGADSLGDAAQQEQVMMIAIGAALVFIALILFIIIRKKKARRQIDFNTATQTQIE